MTSMLALLLMIMGVTVVAGLFFIPTFIALGRDHPAKTAIFVLNLLALVTGLTWIAAVVMALWPVGERGGEGSAGHDHGGWW